MAGNGSREQWTSRLGVILAVAGSAIGLGNFLRFPTQAALHGGGAFMIPYFCALIFLGLPLMWLEWALGRYGGLWGRHNLPGIYDVVSRRRWAKYLGVLGIYVPFIILVYYTYVESWTLGYSAFSALGGFTGIGSREGMGAFLDSYLGYGQGLWCLPTAALGFLLITLALNFCVIYRGVSGGIEKLNLVAMPLLFVMAVVLVVRVLTLPGAGEGLNFLWQPDFGKLRDARVWLAAAGQIFFTLSLGLGAIITYSSYLRRQDDVALAGLTSASLNELAEVVLGASIAIPAAVVFFGTVETVRIAQGGSFSLGFMAMPLILQQMPLGAFFGALWFLLLFFAGLTSTVSLIQPIVAFLQDELGWTRHRATLALLAVTAAYLVPVVALQQFFVDEMDFWAANILLAVGALIEVLMFVVVLGIRKGWQEINTGAKIRLPRVFRYILTYVTPVYLVVMLGSWIWQQALPKLALVGVSAEARPFILAARLAMLAVLVAMSLLVWYAWRRGTAGRAAVTEMEEAANVG